MENGCPASVFLFINFFNKASSLKSMFKEPFMPETNKKPEDPKEKLQEIPQEEEENIFFTYPDGTVGAAKSKKEAADLMEEYRSGK